MRRHFGLGLQGGSSQKGCPSHSVPSHPTFPHNLRPAPLQYLRTPGGRGFQQDVLRNAANTSIECARLPIMHTAKGNDGGCPAGAVAGGARSMHVWERVGAFAEGWCSSPGTGGSSSRGQGPDHAQEVRPDGLCLHLCHQHSLSNPRGQPRCALRNPHHPPPDKYPSKLLNEIYDTVDALNSGPFAAQSAAAQQDVLIIWNGALS